MTLLTKPEAEKLVKQASSVARVPAAAKDIQAVLAGNKDAIILLAAEAIACCFVSVMLPVTGTAQLTAVYTSRSFDSRSLLPSR
jgi:hypothetical protein